MWTQLNKVNHNEHDMYIHVIPRDNRFKGKERIPAWFANTCHLTSRLSTVWQQQRSSVCDVAPWQHPWDPHPAIPTPGLCIGGLPNNWALCPAGLHWHPAQEPGGWLSFWNGFTHLLVLLECKGGYVVCVFFPVSLPFSFFLSMSLYKMDEILMVCIDCFCNEYNCSVDTEFHMS